MSDKDVCKLQNRIDVLESVLFEIAMQAHGHRRSTLRNNDENVALANIRNLAAITIDQIDVFKANVEDHMPISAENAEIGI